MTGRTVEARKGLWSPAGTDRQRLLGITTRWLRLVILLLLTAGGAVIFAAPLAWMVSTAFKPPEEV